MKVLHTNFLRGWGGQSNRILDECKGLAGLGNDVLLSVPPGSELGKRARAAGLNVTEKIEYRATGNLVLFRDVFRLRKLIRDFAPDILHLHGGRDSWVAAGAMIGLRGKHRPFVLRTKHNEFPISDHPLNRWMYGRFFDGIVAISSAIREQCASKPYVRADRIVVIPSACEAARFEFGPETREQMRAEFGFTPADLVIAMTGRLRPEKGHAILIAAALSIVAQNPNARFLLLGSGSMHGELGEKIARESLESRIVLAGFRTDVPRCLTAADIYVQPSLSEGLGTSVLEACAAALPVIASRTGGIPDIIRDNETGLLVTPRDPDDLARAVNRLASDAELRDRLGRNGREYVRTHFSIEALVSATDKAYEHFLALR